LAVSSLDGISVVISTYSKGLKDQVLDCIESLQKQSYPPNEILLVLDKDPTLISFFRSVMPKYVKVIASNGFGLSVARNAGVKNSKSEVVMFIDDDAIADRDLLKNIYKNFSDPSVVGVGGLIKPLWIIKKSEWFPEELNWIIGCSYKGLSDRREPIRNPIGCNMSFRRSVFSSVGYFRSDVGRLGKVLLDGEEPEFSMRVFKKIPDAIIMNEPSAVVHHKISPKRMRFGYLWRRSFYQGLSKGMISAAAKGDASSGLSLEQNYLNYLLTVSVTSRVRQIYRLKNLSQLAVLIISSALVFAGFAVGKIRSR
jgi:glycosyltransferase involved in cell wall biosynthesis